MYQVLLIAAIYVVPDTEQRLLWKLTSMQNIGILLQNHRYLDKTQNYKYLNKC